MGDNIERRTPNFEHRINKKAGRTEVRLRWAGHRVWLRLCRRTVGETVRAGLAIKIIREIRLRQGYGGQARVLQRVV
jgi:hypothetical protein